MGAEPATLGCQSAARTSGAARKKGTRMKALVVVLVLVCLAFAPPHVRRPIFRTLSLILTTLGGVLLLTWASGARPRRRF